MRRNYLAKDEKEKDKKKGRTVPTRSMYALAQMLKDARIDVINIVNLARDLHDIMDLTQILVNTVEKKTF